MFVEADKRLALQAYEQILELLLSGSIEPGWMATERRLAETLNMSRTPVRDALLMLEGEGLLVRQGSRGLQVRQIRTEDYMEALQVRQLLEPEAARIAAGRVSTSVLDSLSQELEMLLDVAGGGKSKPDRAVVRELDDLLHDSISKATGNQQLVQIVKMLRRQTQIFDLRSMPERLDATCQEHLALVMALRKGDGDEAAALMKLHIENIRLCIIRRLTGT